MGYFVFVCAADPSQLVVEEEKNAWLQRKSYLPKISPSITLGRYLRKHFDQNFSGNGEDYVEFQKKIACSFSVFSQRTRATIEDFTYWGGVPLSDNKFEDLDIEILETILFEYFGGSRPECTIQRSDNEKRWLQNFSDETLSNKEAIVVIYATRKELAPTLDHYFVLASQAPPIYEHCSAVVVEIASSKGGIVVPSCTFMSSMVEAS